MTGVFLLISQNFKEQFFYRTTSVAASHCLVNQCGLKESRSICLYQEFWASIPFLFFWTEFRARFSGNQKTFSRTLHSNILWPLVKHIKQSKGPWRSFRLVAKSIIFRQLFDKWMHAIYLRNLILLFTKSVTPESGWL